MVLLISVQNSVVIDTEDGGERGILEQDKKKKNIERQTQEKQSPQYSQKKKRKTKCTHTEAQIPVMSALQNKMKRNR